MDLLSRHTAKGKLTPRYFVTYLRRSDFEGNGRMGEIRKARRTEIDKDVLQ